MELDRQMIKELIAIANKLDERGLVSEASVVDKIAGDLLQFDLSRRKNPVKSKPSGEESGDVIDIRRKPKVDLETSEEEIYEWQPTDEEWEDDPPPLRWDEIVENNYFENPIIHPNGAEQVVESDEVLSAFVREYLTPEPPILNGDAILEHVLYTDSEELRGYMIEVIPSLISDLSEKLNDGDPPNIHKDLIITLAKEMTDYEHDDDFKHIIDAMEHYLEDYIF